MENTCSDASQRPAVSAASIHRSFRAPDELGRSVQARPYLPMRPYRNFAGRLGFDSVRSLAIPTAEGATP